MSTWLSSLCDSSASVLTAPGQIQAIAAVIWQAKETDSESSVRQHFLETLFRCVMAQRTNPFPAKAVSLILTIRKWHDLLVKEATIIALNSFK